MATPAETIKNSKLLLAVNIGNLYTRFGLFEDALDGQPLAKWTITTPARITPDEARLAIDGFVRMTASGAVRGAGTPEGTAALPKVQNGERPAAPADSILSSVVPTLTDSWVSACQRICGRRPLVVGPGLKSGIKLNFDNPAEVGADRIADMVAARDLYGAPLIVIDLGTATSIEVIDRSGAFAGGIIAPGMTVSAAAISSAAAKLNSTELKAPKQIIGKSTTDALRSGIVMGEVARIDGLVRMIHAELGYDAPVVISGHYAAELAALSTCDMTPAADLTLRGLSLLYALNRRNAQ
jgi:type III pantothenate kinase